MQQPALKLLAKVASLRLTFIGMTVLVTAVLASYLLEQDPGWWLVAPLCVLAINLAATIAINPRLNRRPGLLIFHIGLLAVIILVAYGRLVNFHGRLELVTGQAFDHEAVQVLSAGPWHPNTGLSVLSFIQGSFRVDYAPGVIRQRTRSEIRLQEPPSRFVFGDNEAFAAGGYVFHTTSNKGFAALVTWQPVGGRQQTGAIHFPSFPLNEWRQINHWQPQGSDPLKFELTGIAKVDELRGFSLDETTVRAAGLRLPEFEQTLLVGEMVDLPAGRLRLDAFRPWIGYEIRSEPATLWAFLAAVFAVCGIGWHFGTAGRTDSEQGRSEGQKLFDPSSQHV